MMMDEKKHIEFLGTNKELSFKILKSPKIIKQYMKLYNSMCVDCRKKVLVNPKTPIDDYCDACKNKAVARMEKVQEMLK